MLLLTLVVYLSYVVLFLFCTLCVGKRPQPLAVPVLALKLPRCHA